MNTQRTANEIGHETVRIETDHKGVQILRTTGLQGIEFEISDDEADTGGDPYNSTGQHCVIKDDK